MHVPTFSKNFFILGLCAGIFCLGVSAEQVELLPVLEKAKFLTKTDTGRTEYAEGIRSVNVSHPGHWSDIQLVFPVQQHWNPGETLQLCLDVRTVTAVDESGEGWVLAALQKSTPPHAKILRIERSVPQEWTTLYFPFVTPEKFSPEGSSVILAFGNREQKIEIRNVSLKSYGRVSPERLEKSEVTYAGREPGAQWRKDARARIEELRKAPLRIHVVDENGQPVPDASVVIQQLRHAFAFGSAVDASLLLSDTPDAHRYQEVVSQNFNRVVLENDLKWAPWKLRPDQALKALAWLAARDIEVRGHVLVWPSFKKMYRAEVYENSPEALSEYIRDHVRDIASTVGNLVQQWDVLNEPYDNHDAMDILGKSEMSEWFRVAKASAPDAKLFINDYGILSGGGADISHQQHYEETIGFLLDQKAPLEGIGFQSHFATTLTSPEKIWNLLERFGEFGLPMQITELDVDVESDELQADYLRDLMTLYFSHPKVEGILIWGFWEGKHYKPRCALYHQDWSLKPAGYTWRDLVFNQWWSRSRTRTDPEGWVESRVFFGEYVLQVETDTGTTLRKVSVEKAEGNTIEIIHMANSHGAEEEK
ncbi:endo-1,4-beta-xylanase [Kiritimatiellaeota bacterium B1221]|nr:endo-1,4-beta-xylanase [Kiritimatiellaeota bacterium B1221]